MSSILKKDRTRILAAWLLYGVSFFLVAMDRWGPVPEPHYGWNVALAALVIPIADPDNPAQPANWLARVDFVYVAVKISGLINVVFVLTAICGLSTRPEPRSAFKVLRVLVLLMMPFCLAAFYGAHFYPREG